MRVSAVFQSLRMLAGAVSMLALGCGEISPEDRFGTFGEHFMAAKDALADGDTGLAMEELTRSIEAKPNAWAYLERARLFIEQGEFDSARSDTLAGLELQPENRDLRWLAVEMDKPLSQRFKGRFASPPSATK